MSKLFQIQERLQETSAAMGRLEASFVQSPSSPSLHANLRSLRKMQRSLEAEFLAAADERGWDVCSYRIAPQNQLATALALSKVLETFQTVFSLIYEAIKTGLPKPDRKPSDEAESKTELLVA